MNFEKIERGWLSHSKNIPAGEATVIYADAIGLLPASWVLPGGRRTTSEEEARACAQRMNELMLANKRPEKIVVIKDQTWPA
jgi:hypothetical protein